MKGSLFSFSFLVDRGNANGPMPATFGQMATQSPQVWVVGWGYMVNSCGMRELFILEARKKNALPFMSNGLHT